MDKGQWGTIALLTLILGTLVYGQYRSPPPQMWEYAVESIPDIRFDETMARLGSRGWEAASCRRATGTNEGALYECIFKRPMQAIADAERKVERARRDVEALEAAGKEAEAAARKAEAEREAEAAEREAQLRRMADDVNARVAAEVNAETQRKVNRSKAERPCNRPWPETCE